MSAKVYSVPGQTIVTRNNSLETCARLLFILLQDIFTSVRLQRVHKNHKNHNTLFVPLNSNNIIGQRKTTNKEKHFYP